MLVLMAFAFLDLLFRKVMFYKEKVGRDSLRRKRDILEGLLMTLGFAPYLHMLWSLTLLRKTILHIIFNYDVTLYLVLRP